MKRPILAVLCDLDGVITKTAKIHAQAWKQLFDSFFQQYAAKSHHHHAPFDIVDDYAQYVDGKPRINGITSYLQAKNINIPLGHGYSAWLG
jgi:trehalose 6-phosphate phosphatase